MLLRKSKRTHCSLEGVEARQSGQREEGLIKRGVDCDRRGVAMNQWGRFLPCHETEGHWLMGSSSRTQTIGTAVPPKAKFSSGGSSGQQLVNR